MDTKYINKRKYDCSQSMIQAKDALFKAMSCEAIIQELMKYDIVLEYKQLQQQLEGYPFDEVLEAWHTHYDVQLDALAEKMYTFDDDAIHYLLLKIKEESKV